MEEKVDLKAIDGVEIKELITHFDERGFFREIIRVTDNFFDEGFGQWSCAMRSVGTGEWHIHERQTDWWHVPIGEIQAYLYDNRPGSVTYQERDIYILDNSYVLKIPPGVAHAFKISLLPMHLFYITSHIYNPADEGRIPYSDIGLTE